MKLRPWQSQHTAKCVASIQFLCADLFSFLKELQAPGKRQLELSVLSALWENLEIEAELQRGESD